MTDELLCCINGVSQKYDHLGRKIKLKTECKIEMFVDEADMEAENKKADCILQEIQNILKRKMKLTSQQDKFHVLDKKVNAASPEYDRRAPRKPTPKTNPL